MKKLPYKHFFVASVIVAPISMGAFDPIALGAVCFFLACTLILIFASNPDARISLSYLGAALVLGCVYTVLQLIPLPPSVVQNIWGPGYDVWSGALTLSDQASAWVPLSLDPSSTQIELAKIVMLLGASILCWFIVRTHGHRDMMFGLSAVGILCATIALLHRLFHLERVYGLYLPQETEGAWNSAPLLNPNHLAGLMVLCIPILIGMGLEEKIHSRKLLWFIASGFLGLVTLLTLSRGGIAALIIALGVFGILLFRSQRKREGRRVHAGWFVLAAIVCLVGGGLVASEAVVEEYLSGDNLSKSRIWVQSWPMIQEFLPFGVGRGAFGTVFPSYNDFAPNQTFTHAENLLVQLCSDWGFIGLVVCALLFMGLFRLAFRCSARPSVVGALAGAIALTIQNFVDFSLELLGVSLPFVVALTTVAARVRSRRNRIVLPTRATLVLVGIAIIFSFPLIYRYAGTSLQSDEEELRQIVLSRQQPFEHQRVADASLRHPSDYLIPYLAGIWAYQSRDSKSVQWLARSAERNPNWGPSHLWIARVLAESGHEEQSMMEYRLAARYDSKLNRTVVRDVLGRWKTYDRAQKLVDVDPPAVELWDALCIELARQDRRQEYELANQALLKASPAHPPALFRGIRIALQKSDLDQARNYLSKLEGDSIEKAVYTAKVDSASGNIERGIATIEKAISNFEADRSLLRTLAELQDKSGNESAARDAYKKLARLTPRNQMSNMYIERARFEERNKRYADALVFYQKSVTVGGGEQALLGVARAAEKQGDLTRALEAYRQLHELGNSDERTMKQRAERLQKRIEKAKLNSFLNER